MTRARATWLLFALCLLLAGGAMAWVTRTSLALEARQHALARQADREERTRLALWRMESQLAPLLAHEVGYTHLTQGSAGADGAPPPKATWGLDLVGQRYSFAREASHAAPAVQAASDAVDMGSGRSAVDAEWLRAHLPSTPEPVRVAQQFAQRDQPGAQKGDTARSQAEFSNRVEFLQNNQRQQNAFLPAAAAQAQHLPGPPHGLWDGDSIHVAWQAVDPTRGTMIQGFTLDWGALQKWLLRSSEDLLPQATLTPRLPEAPVIAERSLVALPIEIDRGPLPAEVSGVGADGWSPTHMVLASAWAALLVAAIAIALLLYAAMDLSERRAAFVSAVTHELRTPLTTFRLYTELLESGMVPDAQRRQHYLRTLRVEAERLTHMVENVLAYARLERGRAADPVEAVNLCDLAERLAQQIEPRVEAAGMQLVFEPCESPADALATARATSVEQVLTNLIDNACKFARDAQDKRVHLSVAVTPAHVTLRVADHGPGLPSGGARWQPFRKSAQAAAESAPGIGLGLALSRRLARQMGGELRCVAGDGRGAVFELVLPRG